VRLDRPEGTVRRLRDLGKRPFGEEPERHDLAVGLVERGDGRPHPGVALRTEQGMRGIDGVRRPHGAEPVLAGLVGFRCQRVQPGDLLALAGAADGKADRDPRQPCAERAVGTPGGQRPVGDHEGLLCHVLGFRAVAEHPGAGRDDRGAFTIHELAEGIAITGKHGVDDRAVIGRGSSIRDVDPGPVR
jgi:hypothetical protein